MTEGRSVRTLHTVQTFTGAKSSVQELTVVGLYRVRRWC